ncbi:MAG TPA: SDR family oxidoreductase [Anaeromyxobacteraceae bacterium]|nr:SDR family oxidoreductase [Anaeromyxobacteraceae bacterium]
MTGIARREAVVVTGGSRGIGAAVARLAAARGYDVAVSYLSDSAAAAEVVRAASAAGARALAVAGDVSREEDVARLFETAAREIGPVRGLVNSAGITGGFARVAELSRETLERVLEVNVTGTILCAREAVRRMSTRRGGAGGAIVNVSSLAARRGGAGEWVHYAASKGAVEAFTLGLAREVAAEGIRVNAVAPGIIDTELHAAAGAPDRATRQAGTIPMQRPGAALEVAEGVLWLLSEAASYTTGAVLDIGGGR